MLHHAEGRVQQSLDQHRLRGEADQPHGNDREQKSPDGFDRHAIPQRQHVGAVRVRLGEHAGVMLGTFTPSERAYSVVYGLDDADPAQSASFPALLSMPFESAEGVTVPDTKVRNHAPAAR